MILAGAHQIGKSFTARPLFNGLTFSIESGERIGLIGPNGAGKSTLLKILAGREKVDEGRMSMQKGLRVGYLEQVPQFSEGATVQSTVLEGSRDPYDWEEMARAQEVSAKLDLQKIGEDTLVSTLSGGWKKRVALARELVRQPDLLLLDEPTNHLDVESIMWLEDLLARANFATITITHDRVFLQKISNRIIEINRKHPNGLLSVNGGYVEFLEVREQLLDAQKTHEQKMKNTLRRETEWLRRGAKARLKKSTARIDATHELMDSVSEISGRNQTGASVRLDFQGSEKNPKKLIEAKGISKSYNGKVIVPKTDILIGPKSRIGLMGPNGCGKSTLIKMLTGEIQPDSGTVYHAERLQVSYFEQNRDSLNPNDTIFQTICPKGDHVDFAGTLVHARSYLARFLFNAEVVDTEVRKLSGGEQSRLLLAKLMLTKANVLVLDEPTNDLDTATLDVLAEVLLEFNGAILLVTHDRYFLDQMTNKIVAFGIDKNGNKELTTMVGLDQWEVWHEDQMELQKKLESQPSKKDVAATKKRKLSYNEQRELDGMEALIQKNEAHLEKLSAELDKITSDPKRLLEVTKEIAVTQAEVEKLYARWSTLTS